MLRNLIVKSNKNQIFQNVFKQSSYVKYNYAEAQSSGENTDLILNFSSPEFSVDNLKVKSVNVPSTTGRFGIMPNHIPTVAQLCPGVVEVETADDVQKYFISGGFLTMHNSSVCDMTSTEIVPINHLNRDSAVKNLEIANKNLSTAQGEEEKALAQIAIDVNQAIIHGIDGTYT
eukprot:TRINITY_DN9130_c0_g1_i1.p1 TRINITY_DN9130_c0_g1~~TRINITY_DN9130_c0_g1_i1.p1  ORF type:complete len:174 (-),score=36.73 TRINITY_DN9130_c0_g1_i1:114-635(-)